MSFRIKQIAGIILNVAFFAVILFRPAGTLRWLRAWIFLGVVLVAATLSGRCRLTLIRTPLAYEQVHPRLASSLQFQGAARVVRSVAK